jgi:hypothetical protein
VAEGAILILPDKHHWKENTRKFKVLAQKITMANISLVVFPESSQRILNVSDYSGIFSFVNSGFFFQFEMISTCRCIHVRTSTHALA